MARPSIDPVVSSVQSWDALINDNFTKLTGDPFPVYYADTVGNLPAANLFDACMAVVWDGTPGNTASLYLSDGSSWTLASGSAVTFLDTDNMTHVEYKVPSGTSPATGGGGNTWNALPSWASVTNNLGLTVGTNTLSGMTAGVYWLEFDTVFRGNWDGNIWGHSRVRDTNGSVTKMVGSHYFGSGGFGHLGVSQGAKLVSIGASDILQIQEYHTNSTGSGTSYWGIDTSSGEDNVSASLKIWKVS